MPPQKAVTELRGISVPAERREPVQAAPAGQTGRGGTPNGRATKQDWSYRMNRPIFSYALLKT